MTNLITEARELIEALHAGVYDDEYVGAGAHEILTELCDALEKAEAEIKRLREKQNQGKMLNPAGEYAVRFAENHGMSVAEAMEQPMVKARFKFFNDAGI